MGAYSVFLHTDLLDSIPRRGKQRRLIMNFVRSLAENPHAPGDFSDQDQSLRIRQIKIIGDHAITYWPDHAAKAVMVVSIKSADQ